MYEDISALVGKTFNKVYKFYPSCERRPIPLGVG